MLDSASTILLITAIASAICILSLYSVYGNVIKHETVLHDLRVRVETLQHQQSLCLAEIKGEIDPISVDADSEPDQPVQEGLLIEPIEQGVGLELDQLPDEALSSSTKAA